eukprot:TRINITY_DN4990_c0_g1_i1.p1 TRINITY_DN4990_c0_g1~~TRINITY_DN4990_c0_g1_i1.p1  ORF type:complete len:175 (+),score=66.50 TRINITY_DN4990_c0_g1_i1:50-526(+)
MLPDLSTIQETWGHIGRQLRWKTQLKAARKVIDDMKCKEMKLQERRKAIKVEIAALEEENDSVADELENLSKEMTEAQGELELLEAKNSLAASRELEERTQQLVRCCSENYLLMKRKKNRSTCEIDAKGKVRWKVARKATKTKAKKKKEEMKTRGVAS